MSKYEVISISVINDCIDFLIDFDPDFDFTTIESHDIIRLEKYDLWIADNDEATARAWSWYYDALSTFKKECENRNFRFLEEPSTIYLDAKTKNVLRTYIRIKQSSINIPSWF
jgi:hypothetical protein